MKNNEGVIIKADDIARMQAQSQTDTQAAIDRRIPHTIDQISKLAHIEADGYSIITRIAVMKTTAPDKVDELIAGTQAEMDTGLNRISAKIIEIAEHRVYDPGRINLESAIGEIAAIMTSFQGILFYIDNDSSLTLGQKAQINSYYRTKIATQISNIQSEIEDGILDIMGNTINPNMHLGDTYN